MGLAFITAYSVTFWCCLVPVAILLLILFFGPPRKVFNVATAVVLAAAYLFVDDWGIQLENTKVVVALSVYATGFLLWPVCFWYRRLKHNARKLKEARGNLERREYGSPLESSLRNDSEGQLWLPNGPGLAETISNAVWWPIALADMILHGSAVSLWRLLVQAFRKVQLSLAVRVE